MTKKVFFYVQHLMGVGHVFRAARIVRALVAAGFEVDLVFGGVPIPDFDSGATRTHFLPPVRAGEAVFNKLELPDGTPVDDAWKDRRRDILLDLFERTRPDIVLTEAFPFGRRQMRFELLPLMEAARARRPKPLIAASIRDILQANTKKPERDHEVVEIIQSYFDHVLVHGDPAFTRLDDTFRLTGEIADKVFYTGLVAPEPPSPVRRRAGVVVSVGGGALGHTLLRTALQAKPLCSLRDEQWTVITGLRTSEAQKAELSALASGRLEFLSFVPDLPALLAAARLSISRVGYNTVADIYAAGCRAVVVPLSDGIETEQITRAALMGRSGLAEAVAHTGETPDGIAAAIDRAIEAPVPDRAAIRLDGAAETARLLARFAAAPAPA